MPSHFRGKYPLGAEQCRLAAPATSECFGGSELVCRGEIALSRRLFLGPKASAGKRRPCSEGGLSRNQYHLAKGERAGPGRVCRGWPHSSLLESRRCLMTEIL